MKTVNPHMPYSRWAEELLLVLHKWVRLFSGNSEENKVYNLYPTRQSLLGAIYHMSTRGINATKVLGCPTS